MITLMTAIAGLLTSLSALWITLADRRRTIAKERREEADADRRAADDEAAALAQSVSRALREEMAQAVPVKPRLINRPTGDDAASRRELWLITVSNCGPLPVTDVQVIHTLPPVTQDVSELFDLQSHSIHEVELPHAHQRPRLAEVAVMFTDAAGRRWKRHLTGGLRLGALQDDGTYLWDEPRFPEAVSRSQISLGPLTLPSRKGKAVLMLSMPLLALITLGWLLYIVLH
ncbi:hypothetical protein [Streptomyces melanogenes]|uniref:hypothetical protein n=1 Tax=Streptomyces melanogenes TaxID=67326 RepID=UPI003797F3F7